MTLNQQQRLIVQAAIKSLTEILEQDEPSKGARKIPSIPVAQYRKWLKKGVRDKEYKPIKIDKKTYTWCNKWVRDCARMFGWTNFRHASRDQAGEMTRFMRATPESFRPVDFKEAVVNALKGRLVIAGDDITAGTATGHVCIVAPEKMGARSGKWKARCPIVANVGSKNFYGRGLNWAFGSKPDLFLYIGA